MALFQNPSSILKAFTSKESVRQAYKAAVDAGEDIAEEVLTKNMDELIKLRRLSPAKTFAQLEDTAVAMIKGIIPMIRSKVIQYRKFLNQEFGRLGRRVDKLTLDGLPSVKEMAQKKVIERLAEQTNEVLDFVTPIFRQADKQNAAFEAARVLRLNLGFFTGIGRIGSAAFGGAAQQTIRGTAAVGEGIRQTGRLLQNDQQ